MGARPFLLRTLVFIAALFVIGSWTQKANAAVYTSPEGIHFTSESPTWNSEEKMRQLYDELLKNTHGEELKYLAEVEVHDGYPKGNGVAGEYQSKSAVDLLGRQKMLPGSIDLYGGSERTTIESVAKTLSHEYGHHVTHYYSIKQDGFSITDKNRWPQSTYAKIRGLSHDSRVNQSQKHRWQLPEIAAEDYVQLFGSPTAKREHIFPSRYEQLQKKREIGPLRWDASMYNVAPQENTELPLASKVPNLYDWYAKNLGVKAQSSIPGEPALKIKQVVKEGQSGYQIQLEWTPGSNSPADMFYTLLTYGDNDSLPEPVVTRKGGEPLEGTYGTLVVQTPTSIVTYKDPNAKGIRHFRVYAQNKAGFVSSSSILTLNMDNPIKVTRTELSVEPSQAADSVNLDVQERKLDLSGLSGWAQAVVNGIVFILQLISRIIEILIGRAS